MLTKRSLLPGMLGTRARIHRAAAIGVTTLGVCANAQPVSPELLLDVDKQAITKLMDPSNYGFRAQRYFAKRYRIVGINFDVLDKAAAEFTVSPFDDLQMTLVPAPERYSSVFGEIRQWNGTLKYPELQAIDVPSDSKVPESIRIPVTLWVRTGAHEVPLSLLRKLATDHGDAETVTALDSSRAEEASQAEPEGFGKLPLRTISGQWFVPPLRTNMVIRPIDGDPRFHVIYEEDPSRVPRMMDTPNAEGIRVQEERKEFLRQLDEEKARARAEKK